ncbi:hypothetical protein E2C01_051684 [Portunus trituberculatus]|uniref:Uncharacterized protein n=1 Tax=Portunus trituberculatus TaxID=210409 RepID=A0A5B7GK88_PORTR|nr:hypothetical protein [Portunus trituberculatus]
MTTAVSHESPSTPLPRISTPAPPPPGQAPQQHSSTPRHARPAPQKQSCRPFSYLTTTSVMTLTLFLPDQHPISSPSNLPLQAHQFNNGPPATPSFTTRLTNLLSPRT